MIYFVWKLKGVVFHGEEVKASRVWSTGHTESAVKKQRELEVRLVFTCLLIIESRIWVQGMWLFTVNRSSHGPAQWPVKQLIMELIKLTIEINHHTHKTQGRKIDLSSCVEINVWAGKHLWVLLFALNFYGNSWMWLNFEKILAFPGMSLEKEVCLFQ